ncbi:FAD-dependent thymidylate synthase [bacterium]|nr:FAD-dependent thymidylate synthase [bacterium]MBT3580890.1 FAD-dependent thymidylate synthase [bacterium]MBT4552456.1 FAD-dependent thymidylate synthase [bacterium]MBT7088638.1 FAD-dependent thymidylate synthase [bacterium]
MKKLINAGKFEILSLSSNALEVMEKAGRTCYKSQSNITNQSAKIFIEKIRKLGHESVLEHSSMTVRFYNISRGFTHEIVRHRLCAFSQESTRYVGYHKGDLEIIVPPHKINTPEIKDIDTVLTQIEECYKKLKKIGWKAEDIRQILPIGIRTEIVMTTNFREWRHIFKLRTSKAAHWEIKKVLTDLLNWCKLNIPVVFDDIQPE